MNISIICLFCTDNIYTDYLTDKKPTIALSAFSLAPKGVSVFADEVFARDWSKKVKITSAGNDNAGTQIYSFGRP